MRGLNQFLIFDWEAFSRDKQFVVTGISEYQDFETKVHLGTKVECVIAFDRTPYSFKDGKEFTNRFEKITFKVSKDVDIPLESRVMPKNVVASIYGEFRNQLSVKCDDIAVVVPKEKQ